jgi:flagella basal body P-ring formation protein FlgA
MKTLLRAAMLAILPLLAGSALAADTTSINGPRVAVPAHDIERGETITDADLVMQTIAPERMRPGIVMATSDLVGRQARRLLRAGEPVRSDDVHMPVLVVKGSTVTMTFAEPGIVLTATGRAMSDAGMGEAVVVQNPVSLRQVSCIVTGAGQVRAADAPAATIVSANP